MPPKTSAMAVKRENSSSTRTESRKPLLVKDDDRNEYRHT